MNIEINKQWLYWATCECGWVGECSASPIDAHEDGDTHTRTEHEGDPHE